MVMNICRMLKERVNDSGEMEILIKYNHCSNNVIVILKSLLWIYCVLDLGMSL